MEKIASAKFVNAPVFKCRCGHARHDEPQMFYLAMCRTECTPDIFAPLPAGLVGRASDCQVRQTDNFESAFRECANLVWLIKALQDQVNVTTAHVIKNASRSERWRSSRSRTSLDTSRDKDCYRSFSPALRCWATELSRVTHGDIGALAAGAHVVGVDSSDRMLVQARSHFSQPTFETRVGDVESLPLQDEEADVVLANMVLAQHFHARERIDKDAAKG